MVWGSAMRDLAKETRTRLDDHLRECTKAAEQTQLALEALAKGLDTATRERRDQFDKMAALLQKIMFAIIAGLATVIYDILKAKGIL